LYDKRDLRVCRALLYGKRDLSYGQKRPIIWPKETYHMAKRDVLVWEKRPYDRAKETYHMTKQICHRPKETY